MSFLTSLRPTTTIHHLLRPPPFSLSQSLLQQPNRSFTASPTSRLARMSIIGRLADTPEIVATSSGQDIIRYALGTSHGQKDHKQTTWWKVSSFVGEGPGRDLLMGLGKGSMIFVEGDCSMNRFQGKDGQPTKVLSIVQRSFEVLARREPGIEGQAESEGVES